MDNQPNAFPGTSLPEPRAPTNFFLFLHMWWIMVCFSFIPEIFQSTNDSLTFCWYTLCHFRCILFYYSKNFRWEEKGMFIHNDILVENFLNFSEHSVVLIWYYQYFEACSKHSFIFQSHKNGSQAVGRMATSYIRPQHWDFLF